MTECKKSILTPSFWTLEAQKNWSLELSKSYHPNIFDKCRCYTYPNHGLMRVGMPAIILKLTPTIKAIKSNYIPLRLAPVVPAPPWWSAASILENIQLKTNVSQLLAITMCLTHEVSHLPIKSTSLTHVLYEFKNYVQRSTREDIPAQVENCCSSYLTSLLKWLLSHRLYSCQLHALEKMLDRRLTFNNGSYDVLRSHKRIRNRNTSKSYVHQWLLICFSLIDKSQQLLGCRPPNIRIVQKPTIKVNIKWPVR